MQNEPEINAVDASTLGPLTEWANEPKLKTLKEDLEATKNSSQDHILKIKNWRHLRDITGPSKPKKIPGRSSVQPKLIRRQNEWRYSALTEPFLSSDKMFDIDPVTFEDQEAAKQNELVLNWQFRTKFNSVKFIDEYVRTDVDEGTVIVRVGWKRYSEERKKQVPVLAYYPVASAEEQEELQYAMQMKEQDPNGYENLPETLRYAVDYFEETQVPVTAQPTGEMTEVTETVVLENKPTLTICNPENLAIDPSCEGDADKARFMIYSFETSHAELKKDGRYKNLENVNYESSSILAQPDHETLTPDSFNFPDKARKRIVAYEYWGLYDISGEGILEPIVATWIGDTLIRMEKNPFPDEKPPFVVVPYLPMKRSVMGETDAELLEDNQKILGAVTRGMIDTMARSANGQTGIAKGMLDAVNKRRFDNGQNYEFNPAAHPQNGLMEHKYPELSQSALTMLTLQNNEAEALTGVKAFSGGMSGDAYGDVAAGIRGMLDASAKREMGILRRLAQGMMEIGTKIMMMNQVFMSEEETIRVTNKRFVKVRREDLKGNFDLRVDISTAEVDDAKSKDLAFMLQTVGPNMEMGIQTMIFSEIASLKRMPALAERLARYEPKPDPLMEEAKKLEVEKLRLEVEELRSKVALNQAKTEETQAEADLKELEFVEKETGTNHERDIDRITSQGRANQDLEVTKALLKGKKEGEKPGSPEAAIGFNALTDEQAKARTELPSNDETAGGYVNIPETPLAADAFGGSNRPDPSTNLGSKYYDRRQDPALNPALNL